MGAAERLPGTAPRALAEALGHAAVELAAFQDEPPQMASGAVGKTGSLRLGFEQRGVADVVLLVEPEGFEQRMRLGALLSSTPPCPVWNFEMG